MAANDQLIVAAILVAGGSGQRLGASVPKAFVLLGDRQPMLSSPARLLNRHRGVRDVIVVAPAGWTDAAAAIVPDAMVVVGGSHRQKSVERGLAALQHDVDAVLVHDAARPFVPSEVVDRVIAALVSGASAVVPVVPLADTVKRIGPDGVVIETLSRADLRAVQTPQGFRRDVLVTAHVDAPCDALDDASLVERLGLPVVVVEGAEASFKITTAHDLERAVGTRIGD